MKININDWFQGKRAVCVLVVLFALIVCTLTYAIALGMKQRGVLVELHESADRIMESLEAMEAEKALEEKAKADTLKLEEKTAKEMKIDE